MLLEPPVAVFSPVTPCSDPSCSDPRGLRLRQSCHRILACYRILAERGPTGACIVSSKLSQYPSLSSTAGVTSCQKFMHLDLSHVARCDVDGRSRERVNAPPRSVSRLCLLVATYCLAS